MSSVLSVIKVPGVGYGEYALGYEQKWEDADVESTGEYADKTINLNAEIIFLKLVDFIVLVCMSNNNIDLFDLSNL